MLTAPLRAPVRDGALLAVPPLADAGRLLQANRVLFAGQASRVRLLGHTLAELQTLARKEVLQQAVAEFDSNQEPLPPLAQNPELGPLLLAGHQPELFHPGVWVKNFALAGLARSLGATSLNLVVTTDTLKHASLRVPTPGGDSPFPHLADVPFDRTEPEIPFEARQVSDLELFQTFPDRVLQHLRPWGLEPLLPRFWPEVLHPLGEDRSTPLGDCFARARRALERSWGCHNLEVTLTGVCRTRGFSLFAAHILAHLADFQGAYNGAVRAYRARNGLRSRNHPVPELAAAEGWLEAPFWGWREQGRLSRRRRLFFRPGVGRTEVRAGEESWPDLPPVNRSEDFLRAWLDLEGAGLKVRSKALVTTLFARLVLGDLFIHGIGGGKYDEVTDDIVRDFFNLQPPAYLVLSGTLRLPLPAFPTSEEDRRKLAHEIRDLHWNPQRHLSSSLPEDPETQSLLRQRQHLVEAVPDSHAGRRERFRTLQDLTASLRSRVGEVEGALRDRLRQVERELAANRILTSREYSFCLFPETLLRPFCTRLLDLPVVAPRPD